MRITFVISSLASGGAERVMSTMANYWVDKGWDVTLITLSSMESDFYVLSDRVERVALDLLVKSAGPLSAVRNNLLRVLRLRRAISRSLPDVVISFADRTNVLTLLAVLGLGLKVVISERVDPSAHRIGRSWDLIRRVCYSKASLIVAQSESVRKWLRRISGKAQVVVIPNPVHVDRHAEVKNTEPVFESAGKNMVMAMGRLHPQKGFDLLIRAFARIAKAEPAWLLVILGEGPQRASLESLIQELGLSGRVLLPGRVKAPMRFLRQARLFVMSSRYEGFPNALLEAMACGLPVISFDCPSGPGDIIRNGIDGVLVAPEDAGALSNALETLIKDEAMRGRFARNATDVLERFGLEKVMSMWEKTILGSHAEK